MQSLLYVPGSNGAANASLATIQAVRAPGAVTNTVNTVAGFSTFFYATMGTPRSTVDPVTGETITVITEASAVDFAGTLNAGKIDIVAIAPGYTDLGSKVGDIIIVRPVTEWANNLFNILNQSHQDNGKLKTTALDDFFKPSEIVFDYVASGAILAGLSYGGNLNVSLSAGICYINGLRQVIPALASRTYTASKDTYVDALYNASGTATIVYTEVANNATSPALAANSVRLGIVVSGSSNIAAAGSINQGQILRTLPLVNGEYLTVTDALGNFICPRDPSMKTLLVRDMTTSSSPTGSTTGASVVNGVITLRGTVNFPQSMVGRRVKVSLIARNTQVNNGAAYAVPELWAGAIGSGTSVGSHQTYSPAAAQGQPASPFGFYDVTAAGAVQFNVSMRTSNGANTVYLEWR